MRIEHRESTDVVINVRIPLAVKLRLIELATSRDVALGVVALQALKDFVASNPVRRPAKPVRPGGRP